MICSAASEVLLDRKNNIPICRCLINDAIMTYSTNTFDQLDLRAMLPDSKEGGTLALNIATCLRAAIQSGLLPDGIELNQAALAEHFGVSRIPVREAMRSLEAEGWVSARAHYRAVVQAVSAERVHQIFELRSLLEADCLGRAIRTINPERIKRLYAMCDRMDKLRSYSAWLTANRQFHRMLLESSDSNLALELLDQLTSQVERYLRLGGDRPVEESQAGDEHRAILRAVARREAGKARRLMRQHIKNAKRLVLAVVKERQASK
jgi:DNA-binding GntR family transcriptional regulator